MWLWKTPQRRYRFININSLPLLKYYNYYYYLQYMENISRLDLKDLEQYKFVNVLSEPFSCLFVSPADNVYWKYFWFWRLLNFLLSYISNKFDRCFNGIYCLFIFICFGVVFRTFCFFRNNLRRFLKTLNWFSFLSKYSLTLYS